MPPNTDEVRGRPHCLRNDAIDVLQRLRDAGHHAYFAGGCVRDLLLKLEPKDYDVATDAPPARVRELFPRTQAVGAAFGVVLVRQRSSVVEVATFRTDGHYADGRHPESVQFASAEEDARRRDFTINGLFFDPIGGDVLDYVGGQADLRDRLLRAIGDPIARLAEDHLRLLRAVRFAARFDLEIEPATSTALSGEAHKLRRISPERIADELRLMLTPPTRFAAWLLLWQYGLVGEIFRQVGTAVAVIHPPMLPMQRSVFLSLAPGFPSTFPLALLSAFIDFRRAHDPALAGVVSHLSATNVQRAVRLFRTNLKLSNAEVDAVEGIARGVVTLLGPTAPTVAQRKRFLAMPTADDALKLMHSIATAGEQSERIASEDAALSPLIGTEVAPRPLITGDDLKEMGMRAGPAFKRILDAVYDAQLEGDIATVEAARAMARAMGV